MGVIFAVNVNTSVTHFRHGISAQCPCRLLVRPDNVAHRIQIDKQAHSNLWPENVSTLLFVKSYSGFIPPSSSLNCTKRANHNQVLAARISSQCKSTAPCFRSVHRPVRMPILNSLQFAAPRKVGVIPTFRL